MALHISTKLYTNTHCSSFAAQSLTNWSEEKKRILVDHITPKKRRLRKKVIVSLYRLCKEEEPFHLPLLLPKYLWYHLLLTHCYCWRRHLRRQLRRFWESQVSSVRLVVIDTPTPDCDSPEEAFEEEEEWHSTVTPQSNCTPTPQWQFPISPNFTLCIQAEDIQQGLWMPQHSTTMLTPREWWLNLQVCGAMAQLSVLLSKTKQRAGSMGGFMIYFLR